MTRQTERPERKDVSAVREATAANNARRLQALRQRRALPLHEAAKLLHGWGPCRCCGAQVVYLKLDGQLKAFGDVADGIAYSHDCGDPPSTTLRAWSGGAFEQSRRRH